MDQPKIRFAYRKGLLRLWVLAAVLWLCYVGWAMYISNDYRVDGALDIIFGPPLGLLALGVAIVWVIEGFAKADR